MWGARKGRGAAVAQALLTVGLVRADAVFFDANGSSARGCRQAVSALPPSSHLRGRRMTVNGKREDW